MTPTEFVNSILSACDASNWDADRNTGDYFKGLRDAYEAVQEIATDYQTAMYEWTRSRVAEDELRKAREALLASEGVPLSDG
jgi:hypothetical protein